MTEGITLAFGLRFADLYDRDGLVRLDGCFVDFLKVQDPQLHGRLMAARAAPEQAAGKPESELIVELAPVLDAFIAELFGIAHEVRALRSRHDALAPLYSVKRLFVQRRAAKKYGPDQAAGFDGPALRERARAAARRRAHRIALRRTRRRLDEGRGRARRRARSRRALRRLGDAHAAGPGAAQGRRAVQGCRTRSTRTISFRSRPRVVDGVTMLKLPRALRRARDGFALTDPGTDLTGALDHANYCIWCHNQGKDSCSKGLKEKNGEFKKIAVRRDARRLPARREDLGDESGQGRRPHHRRARHRRGRQSDVRGHRAPHLQRLHEGLHLPEAGAGRHSAGRDPHPQGRAGAAVGLRDLLAADALESAQPAPAVAEAGHRPQGSGRRPRPGRLHARASSDERRPHRGGDRRAQDRAARCRDFGGRCRRRARAVPPDPRRRRAARAAGEPGHGRLRRRRRVRHHRALGQEFPQAHPPAAGTAPRIRDVRRRALRRHAHHRQRLRARLRPHRAVRRRRPPDHRADEERACRRRAPGLRLPDGAAAHRRRQDRQPRQSAGAAAGGGHRRRTHRHRHRDRGARLLSAAGGEVPQPLRDAARGARRSRHPRRLDGAGSRDRVRVSRARARHPRRARAGRARGPQAAVRGPPSPMGRRHHRLSATHDRFPELHAQPRRGGEGAGGGDRFLPNG